MRKLPSGAHVHEIRRTIGRWSFALSSKVGEAKRERSALNALADARKGAILDRIVAHDLTLEDVVRALAPGGRGIDSLEPQFTQVTLKEACDGLLVELRASPSNTQRIARSIVKQLLGDFGDVKVASLSPSHVQRWLRRKDWHIETQKLKRSYAARVWEIAIRLERHSARAHGKVPTLVENPWVEIKMPREKTKRAGFLSLAETHEMLDRLEGAKRARDVAFLACGFLGTMRISEAGALRWRDIDFDLNEIEVRATQELKTKKSARVVQAPPRLMQALARWKMRAPSGAYVFGTERPVPTQTAQQWARKALNAAGQWDLTFHSGRHSAITNALNAGISVPEVVEQAGVSAETLLSTYAHVIQKTRSRIAKAYDLPEKVPDATNPGAKKSSAGAEG